MPPKKKVEENGDEWNKSLLSVDDYTLPKSMILRLAKGVLPPNTQIERYALLAILKSTTVFVSYLASNADDRAQLANKKTIRPEDVFGALEEVEFGGFVARVEAELNKYQDIQNNKRNDYRRRVKEDQEHDMKKAGDQAQDTGSPSANSQREKSTTPRIVSLGNGSRDEDTDADADADADDGPPAAKKARTSFAHGGRSSWRDEEDHDGGDDVGDTETDLDVADDDDDDDELEYQSAEEEVAGGNPDDDERQDEDDLTALHDGSDNGSMNPDPDDDDPGGSDED